MKKKKELSEFEFTLLWMAIRYAMNRQTIASATLPEDIVKNMYHRLNDGQRKAIVADLRKNLDENGSRAFGNPMIDRPIWIKLLMALDSESHFTAELIDDSLCTCFAVGTRIYPLYEYIRSPHKEIFLPEENIKQIVQT